MTIEPFSELASIYDKLYYDKNYPEEISRITDHLLNLHIATGNLLSVGCGTGRYEELLASKGYNVVGIDRSDQMLAYATERKSNAQPSISKRLTFIKSDISEFQSKTEFDAVLILFHVVNYLGDITKLQGILTQLSKLLRRGGLIIFDSWNGDGIELDPPKISNKTSKTELGVIEKSTIPNIDYSQSRVDLKISWRYCDINNSLLSSGEELHTLHYFKRNEILTALGNSGFKEIKVAEDFSFTKESFSRPFSLCYSAVLK